jgi:ketosteroid isomerase-like protein
MDDPAPDALAVADRVFAAIESGDVDAVASLYADDVVVWHNTDGDEQNRAANLRVLTWLVAHTRARSYTHIRRESTDTGFVQQHVLVLDLDDDRRASIPACIVATVSGGRITRIDEYLDTAAVEAAFPPPTVAVADAPIDDDGELAADIAAIEARVAEVASTPVSRARRVRSIVARVAVSVLALAISAVLLVSVFDDLDWSSIWSSVTSLGDGERIALVSATAILIGAQGLVTACTVPGLPVRRGVLAYLGPASVASVIPGPSDLPLRFRMYTSWGFTPSQASLAVVSSGVFSISTKLVLPVLASLVAVVSGIELDDGIGTTIVAAGLVLGVLVVLTGVTLSSPSLTARVGRWLQAPWTTVTRLLRKDTAPLAEVFEATRSKAVRLLADRWAIATWAAVLYTTAQLGLMVLALRAMGVPQEALTTTEVFVALGIVQGLTVIPLTAGNVGVSETAWIALMGGMAGGSYVNEVTAAVIIFRALTWLLIIPLGGVALAIWKRSTATAERQGSNELAK